MEKAPFCDAGACRWFGENSIAACASPFYTTICTSILLPPVFPPYFNLEMDESMLALLASYRKRCAQNTAEGQLVLPETMPVLPLYVLCAHKMLALRTNTQVHKELLSPVLTRLFSAS